MHWFLQCLWANRLFIYQDDSSILTRWSIQAQVVVWQVGAFDCVWISAVGQILIPIDGVSVLDAGKELATVKASIEAIRVRAGTVVVCVREKKRNRFLHRLGEVCSWYWHSINGMQNSQFLVYLPRMTMPARQQSVRGASLPRSDTLFSTPKNLG